MYKRVEHEILQSHPADESGFTHFCLYKQLSAVYDSGVVSVTLHEPNIDSTEWQGVIIPEDVTVDIKIDGQDAGTVNLVAGVGEFDFSAGAGTYEVELTADLCQPVKLQVVIQ